MFKNYSLKNYNSFRVNHKANFFLKIENDKSLIDFLSDKKFKNEKKTNNRWWFQYIIYKRL